MKRILILLFALNIIFLPAYAGTRQHFLSYGPGAAASGMGECFTASGDDVSAVYYNPSLLKNLKLPELSCVYWFLYDGARYNFAGVSQPFGHWGTFALAGTQLYRGNIEARVNIDDEPVNTRSAQTAVYASYSNRLKTINSDYGVSLKYISYLMYTESGSGLSLDAGVSKSLLKSGSPIYHRYSVDAGLVCQNFAQLPVKMLEENEYAPFTAKFGVAGSATIKPRYDAATGSFDCDKITAAADIIYSESKVSFGAGLDYGLLSLLNLRTGWREGFTAGLGITYRNLRFDYAFMLKEFTAFNKVGVVYKFGKPEAAGEDAVTMLKNVFSTVTAKSSIKAELSGIANEASGKERARIINDSAAKLRKLRRETAMKNKKLRPLLKKAREDYDKKAFLDASAKLEELLMDYPDFDEARALYDKISAEMQAMAATIHTTDFENLSYAKGYLAYTGKDYAAAVNEWNKVLQVNPNRDELVKYIESAGNYLADLEKQNLEREIEEKVKELFDKGVADFDGGKWVQCIKKMEKVQSVCRKEAFSGSIGWVNKAQGYIEKSVDELSKQVNETTQGAPAASPAIEENKADIEAADKKYNEGLMFYYQGKISDAIILWETALRLNPACKKAQKAILKAKEELELK